MCKSKYLLSAILCNVNVKELAELLGVASASTRKDWDAKKLMSQSLKAVLQPLHSFWRLGFKYDPESIRLRFVN